jgi:hypothetical protein
MSANTPDHATYHRMREQSMKVPWRVFSTACDQLITRRCFAKWAASIAAAETSIPNWLSAEIDTRCPGFLATRERPNSVANLEEELNRWVDHHMLANADEGGWREALLYYVAHSPEMDRLRSVPAWPNHISSYPPFEEWQRRTLAGHPQRLAAAVPEYIDWEAFAFWVRLIVSVTGSVSESLESVIEARCPGFLTSIEAQKSTRPSYSMWCWEQLVYWIEEHQFGDAVRGSWLETLRNTARRHVRNERIVAYWAECDDRWHRAPPPAWPTFEEWLAAADAYVEAAES